MSTAHPHTAHDRPRLRRLTLAVWRNPLARSVDRTEATLVILAIGIWLLTLPMVAVAGSMWWADASATAADQQANRASISAVLTADAADFAFSELGNPISGQVPVPAGWIAPDGSGHSGTIITGGGAKRGETVQIWVDRSGNLAAPPMSNTAAMMLVVLAAVGTWLLLGAMLGSIVLGVHWRLNRRRMADWEHDWQDIEPRWSGRNS
jgi:hypothetical protein